MVPRKAQSSHPKHSQWPAEAVAAIRKKLEKNSEYKIYDAAVKKLAERLRDMRKEGINVDFRLALLKALRNRATEVNC